MEKPPLGVDPMYSNGRSVAIDPMGNVYAAGYFTNTLDFDPGPGIYNMTSAGVGGPGIYLLKLDANGNFLWARQIPVRVEWGEILVTTDNNGNVYLASILAHAADMDPGTAVFMMSNSGFTDAFVVKFSGAGDFTWAKKFGGPGDANTRLTAITTDNNNDIIVCGTFTHTVDFDPGAGIFNLTSTAHNQAFIAKLNSGGDLVWAKQFGNSSVVYNNSFIYDIKCDAQANIFTAGNFRGVCDFDPGAGIYNLSSTAGSDGFVSRLDRDGNFIWAKKIGTDGLLQTFALAIDNQNNLITGGYGDGIIDFDPGPSSFIVNATTRDAYLLKLDQQGNFIWAKMITGSGSDNIYDLVTDINNNVCFIGYFGPSVDFDPGPGTHIVNSPGYGVSTLGKLNENGSFVYAAPFQGSVYDYLTRICSAGNNLYITGTYSGIIDCDPGPGVYQLSSNNFGPSVMKLSYCTNSTSSELFINSCSSYSLNSLVYDSTGTYEQVIANSAGCDSTITLHLTINKKASQQAISICEGRFFYAGGANQTVAGTYIDTLQTIQGCDSVVTTVLTVNPNPVPYLGPDREICSGQTLGLTVAAFDSYLWQDNSTGQGIIVSAPGLYWVKVTNEFGCTGTDTFRLVNVWPLPSGFIKEKDSICSYEKLEIGSLNTYSSYEWSTGSTQRKISVADPGLYSLKVKDEHGCTGQESIYIYPKQCISGIYFPSAFTPNNDGRNDHFKALVYRKLLNFKLQVFDRGGRVVFESADPKQEWDGSINEQQNATGVFVWICSYQIEGEKPVLKKGTVLVIR